MGYRIVKALPEHACGMARVHVDAWREAYAHILPVEELSAAGFRGFSYPLREELWTRVLGQGQLAYVAVEEDRVLGFAQGGPNRLDGVPADGELHAIYIHPDAYRRGIGRALLVAVVDQLISEGFSRMSVIFFQENHRAAAFYKSHGSEFHATHTYVIEGTSCPDEINVWPSLIDLQARLKAMP